MLFVLKCSSGKGWVQAQTYSDSLVAPYDDVSLDIQISNLEKFNKKIDLFREKNQAYPRSGGAMVTDMAENLPYYGFTSVKDVFSSLTIKGAIPNNGSKKNDIYVVVVGARPDGSSLDSPTAKNQIDVVSYISKFVYLDGINVPEGRMYNIRGNYVVARSSGKIEVIPPDLVYTCTQDGVSYKTGFPNQPNIPFSTVSFEEKNVFLFPIVKSQFMPKGAWSGKEYKGNGGPESLVYFSRLLSKDTYGFRWDELWDVFDPNQLEATLKQMELVSNKLGLVTKSKKLDLETLKNNGTPALLFLQDDGRIVTLTAVDDDRAVVIDRGVTQNVERSVLEKRYSGEALVPTKALTQNAAIVADDAVREVKLPSLDAEVPQQFVLRNTGATPITLQLEYPLLGVTESKLSKDVIVPGETATLDLKVKWRSILKAPYQNVLVSIQTNDPIVPRLQLAVLLTPPQAAGQ